MKFSPRVLLLATGFAGVLVASAPLGLAQDPDAPIVQITSPRGRTGLSGKTRIVARIQADQGKKLGPVEFYIDGKLVGKDEDGPPYAVLWNDENPTATVEIAVSVTDSEGRTGKDSIELKPYQFTFKSGVSSVYLEPSVIDPSGRPINGLTESDFVVLEDGVPQTIDLLLPDMMPVTYTLLVDASQSMSRRMDFVRDAARTVLGHLRAHDQIIVAPFKVGIETVTGPTQDKSTVVGAIDAIRAGGGTAILNSLADAATKLSVPETRQIIVLITDGYDENSVLDRPHAMDAVRGARATVYVLGVAGVAGISLKGEDLLRGLATETGGRAFFPARESQFSGVYDLISADVQQRYLLSYTPTNQISDGTWRAITVKTSNPAFLVRGARLGYTAPAPPPVQPQIELTAHDLSRVPVDIGIDDLIVFEDGVEQKVQAFEETVAPVSIMLVLDSSGSMRRDVAAVIEAAKSFVASVRPQDSLGVMLFSDKPRLMQDFSTNREASLWSIGQYKSGGGTALYDAIGESAERLQKEDTRRAVVVLTDGRDENNPGTAPGSVRTLPQISELVRESGTTVFGIGLGPKVDRATLESLAQVSGGEAYFPENVSTLQAEYRRVLEDLRRRFIIRYTSTNGKRDGTWRTVEVKSRREGVVVTSQKGYRAPGKPEK